MNPQNVIEVKDVEKIFRVHMEASHQLKDAIVLRNRDKVKIRHVLNGITFDVKKGEGVALIGKNGCGKSTTLKLLTKILRPDKGTIEMSGRVSSLIELGAGFHPDMTGRENIYINASIFGLKHKEVDKRIEDIIKFSELEEYIDNPVRTYSSGMYMRLAFAVAINVDADILLIDEILAVGDAAFQEKCFAKIEEMKRNGVTIVLVSHSMGQVQRVCDRTIWIEEGLIREEGDTETVCKHYMQSVEEKVEKQNIEDHVVKKIEDILLQVDGPQLNKRCTRNGNGLLSFTMVHLLDKNENLCDSFYTKDSLQICLKYQADQSVNEADFIFEICNEQGACCYCTSTQMEFGNMLKVSGEGIIKCTIQEILLLEGTYFINIYAKGEFNNLYDELKHAIALKIVTDNPKEKGIVKMEHLWEV